MKHVLVIDDEETVLDLLKRLLTDLGYEVKLASSGTEGIILFNNGCHFDLVLTDIYMPGLDGIEVAKHIRNSAKPETPIVAITGAKMTDFDSELFDIVLRKPFKMGALVDVLRSFT